MHDFTYQNPRPSSNTVCMGSGELLTHARLENQVTSPNSGNLWLTIYIYIYVYVIYIYIQTRMTSYTLYYHNSDNSGMHDFFHQALYRPLASL